MPQAIELRPVNRAEDERWHAVATPVITEDMPAWFDHHFDQIFGENISEEQRAQVRQIAHNQFGKYIDIIKTAFPGEVVALNQSEIDAGYRKRIENTLHKDPKAVIIMNDRYMCRGIEEEYPHNIFRFSSTRMRGNFDNTKGDTKSKITPRPGDPSFNVQIRRINDQLAQKRRTLKGARVIIADDVSTTNGTIDDLADVFERKAGAKVDKKASILNYKIHVNRYVEDNDLLLSGGFIERLGFITAEERELYPTGGTTTRTNRKGTIAFQQPTQYPFGTHEMTRTDGFIQNKELDKATIKVFVDALKEVENALIGTRRQDGSIFEFFTFKDFRLEIPVGPYPDPKNPNIHGPFGMYLTPSQLIRTLRPEQMKTGTSKGLHELSMTKYLEMATEMIEHQETPTITHVVEDINGTQRELKYKHDKRQRGFRNTNLGVMIDESTEQVVKSFNATQKRNRRIRFRPNKDPIYLLSNPEFVAYLEKSDVNNETLSHLKTVFDAFYGTQLGGTELRKFLNECEKNGLPRAYHTLKDLTWGSVNFDIAFQPNNGKARDFNEKITGRADNQNGAQLLFISYSPRIHALKMLQESGQNHLITSGKAILITGEDFYSPEIQEALNHGTIKKGILKETAYRALSGRQPPENPLITPLYDRLVVKIDGRKALHPSLILSTGNMVHSDLRPAISTGTYGYAIDKPADLEKLFDYAKFQSREKYLLTNINSNQTDQVVKSQVVYRYPTSLQEADSAKKSYDVFKREGLIEPQNAV